MSQFIKPQIVWTPEKIEKLKKEYPLGDLNLLAKELGATYEAIKSAARRFKVKSIKDKKFYKLKMLFEDSMSSYYWMGFIMADGQIDNSGELKISLSIKDENHLIKLSIFLNSKINYFYSGYLGYDKKFKYCRTSCKDSHYGPLILQKFGLNGEPKTYNPPNLKIKEDKYFISFLLGLIDGDGTFSKKNGNANFIRIEMHKSWINLLELFKNRLNKLIIGNVVIGVTKKGYCFIKIYKHKNLKALKLFSIKYNLPRLERKWESVNERVDVVYFKKNDLNLDLQKFLNL